MPSISLGCTCCEDCPPCLDNYRGPMKVTLTGMGPDRGCGNCFRLNGTYELPFTGVVTPTCQYRWELVVVTELCPGYHHGEEGTITFQLDLTTDPENPGRYRFHLVAIQHTDIFSIDTILDWFVKNLDPTTLHCADLRTMIFNRYVGPSCFAGTVTMEAA